MSKFYRVVGNKNRHQPNGLMHYFPIGSVVSGAPAGDIVHAKGSDGMPQTLYPEHVTEVKRYRVTDPRFPADTYVYDKGDEGYTDEEGQIQDLWHEGVEEATDVPA